MAFIEEIKTFSGAIIRYYKLDNIKTEIDAVRWLSQVRNLEGFVASYIDFGDFLSYDDGSERIEFRGDVNLSDLEENIKKRSIATISIVGYYKEELVVIGSNFYNHNNRELFVPYEIDILKGIDSLVSIEDLEIQLKLI